MPHNAINRTRFRALLAGLALTCALCVAAAVIAFRMPDAHWLGWSIFLIVAAIDLAFVPVALKAGREGNRARLEHIALAMLLIGFAALLQRIGWYAWNWWPHHPTANPFRPVFQFLPIFLVASITLLPTRRALTLCWAAWALVALIAVTGLAAAGISFRAEGALTLLIWLLVAHPMLILMLHAVPHYERALAKSSEELAEMRERTELLERLAETERRFDLVVDGLQVGVWDRWTGPPERRWWSPRFYELIGYAPDELEPTETNLRKLMHPLDRDRIWDEGTRQLEAGNFMDVDFRLLTKSRGYRWFNSHGRAERAQSGKVVRLAGAIIDIHDRRIAEQALQEAKLELTKMAYRDTLTDLFNRRHFDEQFQREVDRARRNGWPLSLVIGDLDHFKAFNDRYGHQSGDACLSDIARIIVRCLSRPGDMAARLGGEEFAILLPETPAEGGRRVAEKILLALNDEAIPHESSPMGRVTISIGVATLDQPEMTTEVLFDQADEALYRVKNAGRNGYTHFRDGPLPAVVAPLPEDESVFREPKRARGN